MKRRTHTALAIPFLFLTSCVAAIGNKGYTSFDLPKSTAPFLEEKVDVARRVVQLRKRKYERMRMQIDSGRGSPVDALEAEIEVEEARIRLLQFRAELEAVLSRKDDDDN